MTDKHQFDGRMVRISNVFDLQMGKTPSRKNPLYWRDGNHDWISIADLSSFGKYVGKTKEQINDFAVKESGIKPIPTNTVLMSFKLSLGKTSITTEPVYTNEAIMAFINKGLYSVDTSFMYHQCRSKNWAVGTNDAVMGKTLNKRTLGQSVIFLPSFEEQRSIAAKLDFIDEQLQKTKNVLQKLDSLVKSRFVEMFESDGRFVTLKECCSSIRGGKTPSMKHPEYYGGDIPFVKSGDVKQDVVSCGVLSLTEKAVSEAGVKLVPKNSILVVTRSAMLHRKMRSALSMRDLAINQDIKAFVPLPEYLPSYLLWAIRSHEQELLSGVRTVSTCALDFDQLCSLKVRRVPFALQQEFASFSSQVDKSRFVDLCSTRNHQACSYLSLV